MYRLDVTFDMSCKEIYAMKLIEGIEEIPYPPCQQISKTGDIETVGYYFDNMGETAKLFKSYARNKKEIPNLIYENIASEDIKIIYDRISETHPELVV